MEMKSPPLQKKRGTTQAPHGSLGGPSSSSSSDPPLDLVSGLSPTRSPPKTKKNRRVEYIDWYKWANDQLERIKMVLNNTDESTDTIRLDKIRKIVIDADAATPPGSSAAHRAPLRRRRRRLVLLAPPSLDHSVLLLRRRRRRLLLIHPSLLRRRLARSSLLLRRRRRRRRLGYGGCA